MKRRRIREIVAAAASAAGEPMTASEIVVSVRRTEDETRGVGIDVLWGTASGASKREALVVALAVHGWDRPWPARSRDERKRAECGQTLDVLDPYAELVHEDILDHLSEPVALPREAPRG